MLAEGRPFPETRKEVTVLHCVLLYLCASTLT